MWREAGLEELGANTANGRGIDRDVDLAERQAEVDNYLNAGGFFARYTAGMGGATPVELGVVAYVVVVACCGGSEVTGRSPIVKLKVNIRRAGGRNATTNQPGPGIADRGAPRAAALLFTRGGGGGERTRALIRA